MALLPEGGRGSTRVYKHVPPAEGRSRVNSGLQTCASCRRAVAGQLGSTNMCTPAEG